MEETQILEYLIDKLAQRLRPMIFEITNEAIAKLTPVQLPKEQDELLTAKQVMSLFGISRATVHNWQKDGVIQSYKIGSKILYKKKELISSVRTRKIK